jgi:hypothetical protein
MRLRNLFRLQRAFLCLPVAHMSTKDFTRPSSYSWLRGETNSMRTFCLLLSLALLGGCAGQSTINTLFIKQPSATIDYIEALKAEARYSHRYWTIYCTGSNDPSWKFQAELCLRECNTFTDGEDEWWAGQGETQQAAAQQLLLSASYHPKHPLPVSATTMEKECPPTLSGGPK